MQLFEITIMPTEDGKRVARVAGRVADHADPEQQREWITFQIAIDAPIGRSGAALRQEALSQARETLRLLALDFLSYD